VLDPRAPAHAISEQAELLTARRRGSLSDPMTGRRSRCGQPTGSASAAGTGRHKVGRQRLGYSTVMSPVIPAQSWSAHHIS